MISNHVSEIWSVAAPALANHLWQSTLFAAAAALLTLALRKNQARARYWLWLAASVKFLIPFSLLVVAGSYMARPSADAVAQAGFYSVIEEVAEGCSFCKSAAFPAARSGKPQSLKSTNSALPIGLLPSFFGIVWFCGFFAVVLAGFARWRRIERAGRAARPLHEGREVDALRRVERAAGVGRPIKIVAMRSAFEPGIFGIFRPVLVWPEGISEKLDDSQLEAILAHEAWHARRRDNLAAAIHMMVEAIFWFHPLVWWMGARLVEERERACDEAVVELGQAPRVYAESILKACEFCVASPLACVSGVTGGGLKKRVVHIMTSHPTLRLGARRKLLLALAAFLTIAVPVGFGLANGKPGQAQSPQAVSSPLPSFEVASIKPDRSAAKNQMFLQMSPGGRFSASNMSVKTLIEFAYHLKADSQILDAPAWVNTQKFDIDAKADDAFVQKMRKLSFDEAGAQMRLMIRSMLADRFNLKVSRETKELPVYSLVVAKHGPRLTPSKLPPLGPIGADVPGPHARRGVEMRPGQMTCIAVKIAFLADVLSRQPEIGGRTVIDETGLKGTYDFTLKWTPEMGGNGMAGGPGPGPGDGPGPGGAAGGNGPAAGGMGPASDASGPSIFTAIQEQLGLKLKPAKGPVEVLVIDHIEPPTPN